MSKKVPAILHTRMDHIRGSYEREKALTSLLPALSEYLGVSGLEGVDCCGSEGVSGGGGSSCGGSGGDGDDDIENHHPTESPVDVYAAIAKSLESEGPIEYTDLKMGLHFDHPIEVWIDTLKGIESSQVDQTSRFLFLFEPDEVTKMRPRVVVNSSKFNRVFSHDPLTIDAVSNGELFQHGGTWILPSAIATYRELLAGDSPRDQLLCPPQLERSVVGGGDPSSEAAAEWVRRPKRFAVSFICGAKRATSGHRVRKALWDLQGEVVVPRTYFSSGVRDKSTKFGSDALRSNPVLPASPVAKILLFDVQYHVAIENVVQRDYFTEKLLDCFLTCTVPIYLGCPNIGDYFQVEGIIQVESCNSNDAVGYDASAELLTTHRIVAAINRLEPDFYLRRLAAVVENYHLAHRYINQRERMEAAVYGAYHGAPSSHLAQHTALEHAEDLTGSSSSSSRVSPGSESLQSPSEGMAGGPREGPHDLDSVPLSSIDEVE